MSPSLSSPQFLISFILRQLFGIIQREFSSVSIHLGIIAQRLHSTSAPLVNGYIEYAREYYHDVRMLDEIDNRWLHTKGRNVSPYLPKVQL